MQRIGNPVPFFPDSRGQLLDGGNIYVGVANADPEVSPITVYSDFAGTIPLTQPIRTVGGFAVNGVTPVYMFIAETDFSVRITDNLGALVSYSPSVYTDTDAFQAASDVLDALVANGTPTAYGLSLLLMANVAALKANLGGLNFLPLTGGSVTGDIVRQGAGVYAYGADPAMTGMKIYPPLPVGTPNPATGAGSLQGFY